MVISIQTPPPKQFGLKRVDDVGVAVPLVNGLLDDLVVIQKILSASDGEHAAYRELEFLRQAIVESPVTGIGVPAGHFQTSTGRSAMPLGTNLIDN